MMSFCEKKSRQMSLKNFIILQTFLNRWEYVSFCKQIPGGNLSRFAGMEIDIPMSS